MYLMLSQSLLRALCPSSRKCGPGATLLAMSMLVFCSPSLLAQTTVNVATTSQLMQAVSSANSAGGNRMILLANGTYQLTDTLYINAPSITLRSASGDPADVVIQGDAMSANAKVGNVIRVAARNFSLRGITLQNSRWHLIQVSGEDNSDGVRVSDCVLRNAYEQIFKVTINEANPTVTADDGIVENCLFEYTAGIGPQYYIGGIDAHGAKNWIVRGNVFRNIISPSGAVAEFAVHFWNGAANNIVERNVIVNCDRGIGFGLGSRGASGGVIRNNMIYHSTGNGQFADVGIALESSPGTSVLNNTVLLLHAHPNAIEYRFGATTNVVIRNNLTNKPITSRDGASGSVSSNVTNAQASWFVNPSTGDLHLASTVASVVDQGLVTTGLTDDFDGDPRPVGAGIDIGADEYVAGKSPMPPTNLTIL